MNHMEIYYGIFSERKPWISIDVPSISAVFRLFSRMFGGSSSQLRPWHGPLRIFRNELLEGLQVPKAGPKKACKGLVDGRFELIFLWQT